jgi:hypothetical protein
MAQLPVFETTRLILRDITERDAPAYERHFIDYEVIGTMSHIVPWPYPGNGFLSISAPPSFLNNVWINGSGAYV